MNAKIFTVDCKPQGPLTTRKAWLAWVQWNFCGKPDKHKKCWIFIGWITMTGWISAVSGSKVTESRSYFRGQL